MRCNALRCKKRGVRRKGKAGALCEPHWELVGKLVSAARAEGTVRDPLAAEEARRAFGERRLDVSFEDVVFPKYEKVVDLGDMRLADLLRLFLAWARSGGGKKKP